MPEHLIEILTWVVTGLLLGGSFLGAFIPIIPAQILVMIAALWHWLMLKEASGLTGVSFLILVLIWGLSQLIEFLSSAAGSRKFGGSKWGGFGALSGGLVGLFFMPLGLFLGPLIGAITLELLIARRELKAASASGIGSLVGVITGILIRLVMTVLMISFLLFDIIKWN